MKQVRLGIIGCGEIVEWAHLPAIYNGDLQDLIKAVAVCDINKKNLKRIAERYNITQQYTDYRDLLREKGIQALDVASGHKVNYQIIPEAVKL